MMRYATVNSISFSDLLAMCRGELEDTITDLDFLESLAAKHCFLVPPWVMQASPSGRLAKVAHVTYKLDGELDKPAILVAVARELSSGHRRPQFRGRFRI